MQAKKKKKLQCIFIFLNLNVHGYTIIQSLHAGLHHFKRKRGRAASDNLSFCDAGRCGTRTLASAGTPRSAFLGARPPHATLVRSPLVTHSPSVHPQKTSEHQSSLFIVSSAENNPKRACLVLTALHCFIVYTREKIVGTTVCTPMSAVHIYVHQT